MKISQDEIDAALNAWRKGHPNNSSEDGMKAILIAAYKVRRAHKAAKRERQRKEKDKQVVESVKAWEASGLGAIEANRTAPPIPYSDWVMEMREGLDKSVLAKGSDRAGKAFGDKIKIVNGAESTPSKAPKWDGTFGVGEWEMRNGEKEDIYNYDEKSFYCWDGESGRSYTSHGQEYMYKKTEFDLIRPWPKPTEGERS